MSDTRGYFLSEITTDTYERLLTGALPVVVLLPVGSVEPHGPHLPLGTDTLISKAVILRAVPKLLEKVVPVIAPAINYGVTDYARGFAGAVSVAPAALSRFVRAVVDAFLSDRVGHVCLINNHLEPEHDRAVRLSLAGLDPKRASVACPLDRRWARTLSDEFKRGECHAGRYETSILMSFDKRRVDEGERVALDEVPISLSAKIAEGITDFKAMGMSRAYAGSPREATAAEGDELIEKLASLVAADLLDAMEIK